MKKKNLLIMDDSLGIQKILTNFLKEDFNITIKNDGMEGLNWLDEGNPVDLILADLKMPNLDGLEFLKIIKSSNFHSHIPVVVLSAESESNERIQCLNLGADSFMIKPFNPLEVLAKLNAILRRTVN